MRRTSILVSVLSVCAAGSLAPAEAVKTEVKHIGTGFALLRDGRPYFVKGAGGNGDSSLLHAMGGNSIRTWGVDDLATVLPDAETNGLTVAAGIWLAHENGSFNYHNADQVRGQFEKAQAAVEKYKDSPALLVWGVGNEMEGYQGGDDPKIWAAVQDIAAMIHKIDPNHPTMTVVAEVGGKKVPAIEKYCPDIDIVGINSYGGGASVGKRFAVAGGTKPYIITEFGPAGAWEVGKTSWGAPIELTSTAKADAYRATYQGSVAAQQGKQCLGSYAFLWGHKQEATTTWFGMFTPDGKRLEAIDEMSNLWSGQYPAVRCPAIEPIKLDKAHAATGSTIHADLNVSSTGTREPLTVDWTLRADPAEYITAGEARAEPPAIPAAISHGDLKGVDVTLPSTKGAYWLYAEVHGPDNTAATADVPLYADADAAGGQAKGTSTTLPFGLYGPSVKTEPFIPSGWMGDTGSIAMDPKCIEKPHDGSSCLKCSFAKDSGWGGVVWQTPANNWGDQPGGYDVSGAKKITFWARGDKGGETVAFKMGLIGRDKANHDSDAASLENVKLTSDWKQYTIDLAGKDLTHVMTGFVWVVAGQGSPVTFYLSDIKYE